jgi:hypothetical protein
MDMNEPPPYMARRIHRLIREKTGIDDCYKELKQRFNRDVLEHFEELQERIRQSNHPLETAIRLAIAGNLIDAGANPLLDELVIQDSINAALTEPLVWDEPAIQAAIHEARSILYITDNAGEIVFDQLLIEQLPAERITAAVRGYPILNDATMEDAEQTGLTSLVKVISNGSDAPGTILRDCSEEFKTMFERADLVIAKGQGNYETLSDVAHNILFILKAKCPVIARHIGCDTGTMVVRFQQMINAGYQDVRLQKTS